MTRYHFHTTSYLGVSPACTLIVILILTLFGSPSLYARDKEGRFIVVIDAGHGGHDSGAKGKVSYEKDVVLAVSKKVGAKINELAPEIKVYYSRPDDNFIGLQDRARYSAVSQHSQQC